MYLSDFVYLCLSHFVLGAVFCLAMYEHLAIIPWLMRFFKNVFFGIHFMINNNENGMQFCLFEFLKI